MPVIFLWHFLYVIYITNIIKVLYCIVKLQIILAAVECVFATCLVFVQIIADIVVPNTFS